MMLALFTFIVPLLVTTLPLVSVIWLAKLQKVQKSVWLLGINAAANTGLGFITTIVAMAIFGKMMTYGTVGNGPNCNFGPLLFLPIGVLFTALTFLTGLYFTGELVVRKVNESASKDWY